VRRSQIRATETGTKPTSTVTTAVRNEVR
jgi:hypothetical protein